MELLGRPLGLRGPDRLVAVTLSFVGIVLIAIGGVFAVGGETAGVIVGLVGLLLVTLGVSFQKRAVSGA